MVDKKIRKWRAQESRVAAARGATLHSGSGNQRKKHDSSTSSNGFGTPGVLIENKRTDKQSYSIRLAELLPFEQRSDAQGKRPEFHIEIDGHDYVLLRLADHLERESECSDTNTNWRTNSGD